MKPMHIAMSLLVAAMFFVSPACLWACSWSWTAPNWWWIPQPISLAVDLHRHRGGLLLPADASLFQKPRKTSPGRKFIIAGDRRLDGQAEAVPDRLLVFAVAWPFYGVARDGGYRHPDHDLFLGGLGLNVVVGAVRSAGAGLWRVLPPSAPTPLRAAEPLLRPGFGPVRRWQVGILAAASCWFRYCV